MQFKPPKNDSKYRWTEHVKDKMRYYGISESLIKRIVRHPARIEDGIAPGTAASMQRGTNKKKPQEIWVMFKEAKSAKRKAQSEIPIPSKKIIISAWRYPGVSPLGKKVPIPEEIMSELEHEMQDLTSL